MSAHIIRAIDAEVPDFAHVKRALLSVSDKTGLLELAKFLADAGVELLSTGGTAAKIRDAGIPVKDVSDYTGFPEMMDGRVKTLHPRVHGGILHVRGNASHESAMAPEGILPIDLVVLNLYAFEATVAGGAGFATCVENIDIGGPSMLRSSAKNHSFVTIATSPDQYAPLIASMKANGGATSLALRRTFAARAFALSASYDSAIAAWLSATPEVTESATELAAAPSAVVVRAYEHSATLKYGCNPQQQPAAILRPLGGQLPFAVRNGTPGYINLLDALNAWQLVSELRTALGVAAAASFKHVSPAGAAVAVPLTAIEAETYEVADASTLTPTALAYLRARQADPMCSFGDFIAVSDVVDAATAAVIKKEVSDGIIAPGYDPEALEVLAGKKGGKFIILEADPNFAPPVLEYREVYGTTFKQRRNDKLITPELVAGKVATGGGSKPLPADAVRDLVLASITVKYTQSNSVGYARGGQMVGVGAGQQSRVDCVKLAGRKVATWYLRQHPKVRALPFKAGTKRQDRVNARVRFIEGDFTPLERVAWEAHFDTVPAPLSEEEKAAFLAGLDGVALSSDAFFPFRDSIDHASKIGVQFVAQPGGSVADAEVVTACEEYGMQMAYTDTRLFHH